MPYKDRADHNAWGRRYNPEWAARNPERQKAKYRRSYAKHAEERRAKRREYGQTEEAKAKAAAYARLYRQRNPGKRVHFSARAYTKILRGDPCCYCGNPMQEIDHISPVRHGGDQLNDREWSNLTAACLPCDRSKKDRPMLVWLAKQSQKKEYV